MEIDWFILGIVAIVSLILVGFIIWKNGKDEKDLELFLNENESPTKENKKEDEINDYLKLIGEKIFNRL